MDAWARSGLASQQTPGKGLTLFKSAEAAATPVRAGGILPWVMTRRILLAVADSLELRARLPSGMKAPWPMRKLNIA
jgi:hypothetical protein